MSALLESLSQFNNVRFSAYRTALKLHALQKELKRELSPQILPKTLQIYKVYWNSLIDLLSLYDSSHDPIGLPHQDPGLSRAPWKQ